MTAPRVRLPSGMLGQFDRIDDLPLAVQSVGLLALSLVLAWALLFVHAGTLWFVTMLFLAAALLGSGAWSIRQQLIEGDADDR